MPSLHQFVDATRRHGRPKPHPADLDGLSGDVLQLGLIVGPIGEESAVQGKEQSR